MLSDVTNFKNYSASCSKAIATRDGMNKREFLHAPINQTGPKILEYSGGRPRAREGDAPGKVTISLLVL